MVTILHRTRTHDNRLKMNIRSIVKQYIDVDSIMQNDEFAQWYERLRKAGFAFLLLNLAYLFGYMCFRVISEFTISSFLFGYFIQMICNVATYVTDTLRSNEREIRDYVEKQVGNWIGTIKISVDYINTHFEEKSSSPSSFASSSKLSYVSQEPSAVSGSSSPVSTTVSTPSRPPVTISLSADSLTVKNSVDDTISDSSSNSSTTDNVQTAPVNINLDVKPVSTTTTINLDPCALEYLLRRDDAQRALMNQVLNLSQSVIEPSTSTSTSANHDNDVDDQIKHIDSDLSISDCNSCDVSDDDIHTEDESDDDYHSSNDDESHLSQDDDSHGDDHDNNRDNNRDNNDKSDKQ